MKHNISLLDGLVWFCVCLTTPGLGQDIWCQVSRMTILSLQITCADIKLQVNWAVHLVITDGQLRKNETGGSIIKNWFTGALAGATELLLLLLS